MRQWSRTLGVAIGLGAATFVAATQALAQSGSQTIIGQASVFGAPAGNNGLPVGSTAPTAFALTAGANRVLTFTSVTGTISLNGSQVFGADGGVYPGVPNINVAGYGGFTGIADSNPNNTAALFAVFTAGTPVGSTTATTDITGTEGNASFSPTLNQVFFVGDGRTGNGSGATQNFFVPATATTLYLGIVDSATISGSGGNPSPPSGYGDNTGSFTATFQVGSAAAPEPSSLWLGAFALLPLGGILRHRRQTQA